MTEDVTSAEFERGQRAERARFAEYLAHYERSSRALAEQAVTDESRIYQVTIANAMKAMSQAIMGGFHWQESWRTWITVGCRDDASRR